MSHRTLGIRAEMKTRADVIAYAESMGYKEHACSCDKCKECCVNCPCLGTPDDILRILESGRKGIIHTGWAVGLIYGLIDHLIEMYQPTMMDDGIGCVYRMADGLCELHNNGLKPVEGSLSECKPQKSTLKDSIAYAVAMTWEHPDNEQVINKIKSIINQQNKAK